jgi:hypothetical protein
MRRMTAFKLSGSYPRLWRAAVVSVAVLSLLTVLANRFHSSATDAAGVHESSVSGKIQHVADDAHHWSAPVARFSLPLLSVPLHQPVVKYTVILSVQVDQPLCNRPPPIA